MQREPLTDRQAEVYAAIVAHLRNHRMPPTVRELMSVLGIGSPNGIKQHLDALENKGWIDRRGGKSRSITLVLGADDTCPCCGRKWE